MMLELFQLVLDMVLNLNPKDIERFLIEYLGKELILVRVQKYINKSNGFPYWRFDYSTNDETHTE